MDFSQRQIRRSAAAFSFGSVPPPDVPRPTLEMGRPQRLLVACAAAYMVLATVPPPDEPNAFGTQAFRPREVARAPSAAYWQFGRNPPEDVPETFGFQDHKPRPLSRATDDSYWHTNGIPPPGVTEDTLIEPKLATPQRLPYAGSAAYQIYARVPPEDEPAAFGYQDTAPRQLPRASGDAYQVTCTFVEPSLLSASNGWQTKATPKRQRASGSAYWIDQRATAEFNPDVPEAFGVQDQTPRPAARSTTQAYFVEQRPIWLEPGEPVGRGFVDSHPRQTPRAGEAAYEFINRLPADQQPVAWGSQTHAAKPAQRANAAAYWVDHVALIQGPDKPASDGHQANNVRAISRASSDAYRLIAPKGLDEPEIPSGYQEHARRAAVRSPASSYWIEQRPAIYEPDAPIGRGYQSQPIAKASRSAASAYVISLAPQIDERPEAFGYVETASLPAKRAAYDAYFIPQRSQAGEFGIPAAFGQQTHAIRPVVRAPKSAYDIAASIAVAEPQSPGYVVVPAVVRSPQRASQEAYWLEIFSQTDEQPPAGRGFIAERAPASQRASKAAYIEQHGVQPSEDNLVQPQLANVSRQPERAPASAYWLDQTTHVAALDAPAARGFVAERAPAAQRASQEAYRALVSPIARAEPRVFGFQSQPMPPARIARQSFDVLLGVPVAEVPPALGYQEQAARQARKTASTAYWLPQRWQTVGVDQPASWGYVETRSLPALRAPRKAYHVTATFSTPEIIRTGPLVQVYGSSSELVRIYGSSSELLQVYGEDTGTPGITGAG